MFGIRSMIVLAALAVATTAVAGTESVASCQAIIQNGGNPVDAVKCLQRMLQGTDFTTGPKTLSDGMAALRQTFSAKYPGKPMHGALLTNPAVSFATNYQSPALSVADGFKKIYGLNLGAGHPAVLHAVNVDMPARGGTPQAVMQYIAGSKQVRDWYSDKFGLPKR